MSDNGQTPAVDPVDKQPIEQNQNQGSIFDNLEEIEVQPVERPEPTAASQSREQEYEDVDRPEGEAGDEPVSEPDGPQGERAWEPSELPDHYSSPEDAYGAAKYFQSRADKAAQQNRELEKRLGRYKSAEPIVEAIMSDPALLNKVSAHLNGSSSGGQATVNTSQPSAGGQASASKQSLQEPTPPEKPADMDPYSDEYQKYLDKREKYLEDLATYKAQELDNRYGEINQRLEQVERERQERIRQAKYHQEKQGYLQELQHVYNLPKEKAEQFMDDVENGYFEKPESLNVLVKAWEMAQNPTADQVRQQRQREAAGRRANANRTPLAATEGGQGDGQPPPFEDQVGDALEQEYGTNGRWF